MYRTVSPILYHTPIVQNLGLFLLGIEQPPRLDDDKDNIPYHKSKLLDKVTKLHLIHSSSRKGVGRRYMTTPWSLGTFPHIFNEERLKTCNADRLGMADLEGWLLATQTFRAMPSARRMFNKLEAVSFGSWDDGRWRHYQKTAARYAPENRDDDVIPSRYLERMLAEFVLRVQTAKSLHVCSNTQSSIDLLLDRRPGRNTTACGLQVFHARSYSFHAIPWGPTRVYVSPIPQRSLDSDSIQDADLARSLHQYMEEIDAQDDMEVRPDTILELCIATSLDQEIYSTSSCENELELARRTKEALELYCQDLAEREEWAKRALDKIKIYVGDEIPACPCCGGKE